jgi:hypothetical protein
VRLEREHVPFRVAGDLFLVALLSSHVQAK